MDEQRIMSAEDEPTPTLRPLVETGVQTSLLPPPPPVPPPDPILQRDRQHLDTLAAFYYILSGLQVFSLLIIPLYAVYVYFVFCTNAVVPAGSPFPSEIGWVIEGLLAVALVSF